MQEMKTFVYSRMVGYIGNLKHQIKYETLIEPILKQAEASFGDMRVET